MGRKRCGCQPRRGKPSPLVFKRLRAFSFPISMLPSRETKCGLGHAGRGRENPSLCVLEECAAAGRIVKGGGHELGNLFAQFAAKDLAGRGLGNSIDKANLARLFVVGETIGNE